MNQDENYNMESDQKRIIRTLIVLLVVAFLVALMAIAALVINKNAYEKKIAASDTRNTSSLTIISDEMQSKQESAQELQGSSEIDVLDTGVPLRPFIKPFYDEYGHITSLDYSFTYEEKIMDVVQARENGDSTYSIIPVLEYSFNDQQSKIEYSYSIAADYSYLPNLFTTSLFYLYEGVENEEYGNFDEVSEYLAYDEEHGYYFDDSENFVKIRSKFEILDCRTGEISYSDWSDYAYYGKGYEKTEEEITALTSKPVIKDAYFRYYHMEYANAVPELAAVVEATEEAKNLSSNISGILYLTFEIKDRSGSFNEAMTGSYNYLDLNGKNGLIFPCDNEEINVLYDLDNIEIRVRYEWYDAKRPPYEGYDPICVSEWSNFTVSEN